MEPKGEKIDHPAGACYNTALPPPLEDEYKEVAWAVPAFDKEANAPRPIEPIWIARPKIGPHQVRFEMLYCGVCHSDPSCGLNEWGGCVYPFVGGHELLGKCIEVGEGVTKVQVGDYVGVGCMVDSCLECEYCKSDEEQYCANGMTMTWNSPKTHGRVLGNPETHTHGGYSGSSVTHEHFVVKIPEGMDIQRAAPILCAGITLWDPIRYHGLVDGPKKVVGVCGLGGLGTMGVKIASALGHKVVAISTSASKESMAKEKGATGFVVTKSEESLKANAGTMDIIFNTISADHDINTYLPLLKTNGIMVMLGGVTKPHTIYQMGLMFQRKTITGSLIGGMKATQEVIDFCHKHNIYPDIKMIKAKDLNEAWKALCEGKGDGVRFVVDIKASLQDESFLPK
ncbi:hypothetical protein HJC23_004311 [Cyclotella cryptica]|uniref:Enoyl reductase (ER) domain-containing protein n=1 Tax=Cyclotella cryptica TaxID=29204 RepID=A0ABD3Q376_9STRA|eukprot:CCRYP_008918-RA/>CCRYP_008918-RA protein AED:0.00 eAED:0.00 QI:216/-1/1/1/-1/1/1/98/397